MEVSIWRNNNFLWLFIGRTISQLGTGITAFAIPRLLLQITGSAMQTGFAFAIGSIPYLLVSLPAGVLADRYDRKIIMIIVDTGRLLFLASIPLSSFILDETPILLLYIVQGSLSVFSAFFDAAYGACLPSIIEKSQLQRGNAILQTGFSLSQVAGPIIGGVLVVVCGAANTILIDVVSYVISIITIFFVRASFSVSHQIKKQEASMLIDMKEGLGHVWDHKILRTLALFSMLINLVGPGMDIALLYRLKNELQIASNWTGIIMASLSCGMVVGSFVMGLLKKKYGIRKLLTISTVGQILPPIILAISTNFFILLCAQFFIGFLIITWNIQTVTIRQIITPNYLLGRIVSIFRMMAWVTIPLGTAIAGVITQQLGAQIYFLFAGCVLGLVALLFFACKFHHINEIEIHIQENM